MSMLFSSLLGDQVFTKYRLWIDAAARFMYYAMTTISNIQTVGEEYSGILQVDSSSSKLALPSFQKRFIEVLFLTKGRLTLRKIVNYLESKEYLQHYLKLMLNYGVEHFSSVLDLIEMLHLVVFYRHGSYYHLSKRIVGVRYIPLRRTAGDKLDYKVIAQLSLANFCINIISQILPSFTNAKYSEMHEFEDDKSEGTGNQCSLCLHKRRNSCCTPCGHVFCWKCLHGSNNIITECPMCRCALTPSQLIPLINYD